MPETQKEYTVTLTDVDRIKVRQKRNGHTVLEFSVQYETLLRGHWRKLTRFDNAHGAAHRHMYYPNKPEYKQTMSTTDDNNALTEALSIIRKHFQQMRVQYILLLERRNRR